MKKLNIKQINKNQKKIGLRKMLNKVKFYQMITMK